MSLVSHCSKLQISNLARLALHLRTMRPSKRFDMGGFAVNSEGDELFPIETPECGTSCCAAGHGPLIGILGKKEETWNRYCGRVFGADPYIGPIQGSLLFGFLFSGGWPNVPSQAAKRIAWALEGKSWGWTNEASEIPASRPDWSAIEALVIKPRTKKAA